MGYEEINSSWNITSKMIPFIQGKSQCRTVSPFPLLEKHSDDFNKIIEQVILIADISYGAY